MKSQGHGRCSLNFFKDFIFASNAEIKASSWSLGPDEFSTDPIPFFFVWDLEAALLERYLYFMPLVHTPPGELGSLCPSFSLPATDGKTYSLEDVKDHKAFLFMVICNHCPYVKAIEDRLIELGQYFEGKPVQIMAVSANDAENYPEDSFEKMKEKNYPFPYLYDEGQTVAQALGAVCTPDFFLFGGDNKLAYRGRLDDNWKEPEKAQSQELKAAMDCLLNGQMIPEPQMASMGCSIKWKNL